MTVLCWHRPGVTKGRWITCRNCGVAIERCPCAGPVERAADVDCPLCLGSTWVSIVRGKLAMFAEYLENRV
jgi:hypothetical protein